MLFQGNELVLGHSGVYYVESDIHHVLLQGNGLVLGHSGVYYVENDIHHVAMNLTERGWTHRTQTTLSVGTPASKEVTL